MADSHAVFGTEPNCCHHICMQCTFPKDDHAEAQRAPRHCPNPPRAARRFGDGEWRARYADIAQRAAERGQPHGADPFAVKHHRSPEQQSHGDCVRRSRRRCKASTVPLGCGATPTAALRQAQGFGDSPAQPSDAKLTDWTVTPLPLREACQYKAGRTPLP